MRGRAKEMHVYLDMLSVMTEILKGDIGGVCESYKDTYTLLIRGEHVDIIRTTITHFLSWDYGERLFVHVNNEIHEITLGKCEGISEYIKITYNLEELLFTGKFDWFDPTFGISEVPSKEDYIKSMKEIKKKELTGFIKWSKPLYICPNCKVGYMREDLQCIETIDTYPPMYIHKYKCNKCNYEEELGV